MEPDAPSPPEKPEVDTEAATLLRPQSVSRTRETHDPARAPTMQFMPATGEGALSQPAAVDVRPRPLDEQQFDERYRPVRVLGEGGMGEVWRCADERVGREVAMKVIRPGHGSRSDLRARFEREARIQGQLEHPSVVPVYDLGLRPDGAAYFTMKRIVGRTLEEILDGLRAGDSETQAAFPRRKLLSAFSNACLAVAFAHRRGVVHRDLKPPNIILGPFGEVYVLDWGVAKLLATTEATADDVARAQTVVASADDAAVSGGDVDGTVAGTLLGTPGHMSPEQARGDVADIDARADIYALGVMLFELLTLRPLHQGRSVEQLVAATLAGVDAAIRERGAGQLPPELEAICAKATALEPAQRYASAGELHDAVERYLAGDRDLQRRHELAEQHALSAERVLQEAGADPARRARAQAEAVRELNAALTQEPTHEGARAALVRLLLESTEELPPEAEAELERSRHPGRARTARIATVAFLGLFLLDPLVGHMGVRSWACFAVMAAFLLASAAGAYAVSRRPVVTPWQFYVFALVTAGLAGSMAIMFGAYVLVPAVFVACSLPIALNLRATRRQRIFFMAAGVLAVVVPLALQWLGWVPPSYAFRDGVITILPWAVEFPALPTELLLLAESLVVTVVPLIVIGGTIDALVRAERRLFAQAWNLRHLVPDEAQRAVGASLEAGEEPPSPYCPL